MIFMKSEKKLFALRNLQSSGTKLGRKITVEVKRIKLTY